MIPLIKCTGFAAGAGLTFSYYNREARLERARNIIGMPAFTAQEVLATNPSPAEISGAYKALRNNPAIIQKFLPPNIHFEEEKCGLLIDQACDSLLGGDFIEVVSNCINREERKNQEMEEKKKKTLAVGLPQPVRREDDEWEALQKQFPCVICQDVLAAPHVINCTHSFCFQCLQDLQNSCQGTDGHTEVMHHCPECKQGFDSTTYERTLDQSIEIAVKKISDDDERKKEWEKRRKRFFIKQTEDRKQRYESLLEEDECELMTEVNFQVGTAVFALIILTTVYMHRARK